MKRREFLIATVALAAVPMGMGFQSTDPALRALDAIRKSLVDNLGVDDYYTVLLHPDIERDIRSLLTPKEKWKLDYRVERMRLKGMSQKVVVRGEIGSMNGYRFIVSDAVTV